MAAVDRPTITVSAVVLDAPDARAGDQRMQLHLDLAVDDLDAATAHAVEVGARLAEHQPQDDVRVLLDPAGHPFCLFRRP